MKVEINVHEVVSIFKEVQEQPCNSDTIWLAEAA